MLVVITSLNSIPTEFKADITPSKACWGIAAKASPDTFLPLAEVVS